MVEAELSSTPRFSEQQQRILRALCKPLFADGDGFNPSSDLEVAEDTGIDVDVVTQELDLLARLFGLEDMPRPERRAEVALLAVRSGLVGADEGGTQAELKRTSPPPHPDHPTFVAHAGVRGGEERRRGRARSARGLRDLGEGDVELVHVAWSSVNYKDALATIAKGQVARISPLVPGDRPGRDAARTAARRCSRTATTSASPTTAATRSTRGCRRTGSCRCPDGLTARQAMAIGTAGYTAARCVIALEAAGLAPGDGPGAGDRRLAAASARPRSTSSPRAATRSSPPRARTRSG